MFPIPSALTDKLALLSHLKQSLCRKLLKMIRLKKGFDD